MWPCRLLRLASHPRAISQRAISALLPSPSPPIKPSSPPINLSSPSVAAAPPPTRTCAAARPSPVAAAARPSPCAPPSHERHDRLYPDDGTRPGAPDRSDVTGTTPSTPRAPRLRQAASAATPSQGRTELRGGSLSDLSRPQDVGRQAPVAKLGFRHPAHEFLSTGFRSTGPPCGGGIGIGFPPVIEAFRTKFCQADYFLFDRRLWMAMH